MYFKDERALGEAPFEGKRMKGAVSSSLRPGSFDNAVYTRPIGEPQIEASILIKKHNENKWYLYGDCYHPINARFYAWETADLVSGNWTVLGRKAYNVPLNAKHGSVVKLKAKELERLLSHWSEAPEWNRIKPYNFPDSYIRASGQLVTVAPYPLDPYEESQWLLVSGLADASWTSFSLLTHPDKYLKVDANYLRLGGIEDETDQANATFQVCW